MTRTDWRWLLAFVLFAACYQLLAWNGATPFVFLTGDAANNASIALAMDTPGLFPGDALLGDPDNFQFYRITQLPLIRLLAPLVGDYGTPHHLLLFPHLMLHLCGFYLLGVLVLKNRLWAGLLAFLLLAPIQVNLGTFWGVHRDSLARCTFQALLPWLLSLAWLWREKPLRWPLIMIGAGLLMAVHAVSAPTWGLALWCGFIPFLPKVWSWPRKLVVMFALGFVFLGAAAPTALNYLAGHAHGADVTVFPGTGGIWEPLNKAQEFLWEVKYEAVRQAWLDRFKTQTGLLQLGAAIAGFFTPAMIVLLAAGLSGAWWLRRARPQTRSSSTLILAWLTGVLLVSVGLTAVEQLYCMLTDSVPVEMNLIRGLRFLIPIMLLFIVWVLCSWHEQLKDRSAAIAWGWAARNRRRLATWLLVAAVLAVIGAWGEELGRRTRYQRQGYILTMAPAQQELVDALDFLREETPPGSLVLGIGEKRDRLLTIRYYGERPVPYAWKDGGVLGYADNGKMLAWHTNYLRWQAIEAMEDPVQREAEWAGFAKSLGADYVFRSWEPGEEQIPLPGAQVVFAADSVVIYRMD